MGRRLWAAAIDNHASGHLSFSRFLRVALFCLIVSLPSPWRAEQIRDIRVGFDVLNVVSGTAIGGFSRDASVFVSSRVCIMHAR